MAGGMQRERAAGSLAKMRLVAGNFEKISGYYTAHLAGERYRPTVFKLLIYMKFLAIAKRLDHPRFCSAVAGIKDHF